jgi:mRNA-degrading endonuclease RelE of RelBE toxin-antitoxin system
MFKIYHSKTFESVLKKSPRELEVWLSKIEDQLTINPYVGDPIKVKWFREKKFGKFRVYYLIYEEIGSVLMVGISDKKDQQKVINTIWLFLDIFKEEIIPSPFRIPIYCWQVPY